MALLPARTILVWATLLWAGWCGNAEGNKADHSAVAPGWNEEGATDGNRFSIDPQHAWRGAAGMSNWVWEIRFPQPRDIGAILQIVGVHPFVLRDAPAHYIWQALDENGEWLDLPETRQLKDKRLFRLFRLHHPRKTRGLRMVIFGITGEAPVLREIEIWDKPSALVEFPEWIVTVNTTHDGTLPGHGQEFIPLAQATNQGRDLHAQQVWLDAFDPEFVSAEPRPLAAFLSGNFKDWCEVNRELWRGTMQVLRAEDLPMWASCGGAQGLAILAETGVDQPWDCPHCRDPKKPLLPIYGHIEHTGLRPCGDYSACVFERGPHQVVQVGSDDIFRGLPRAFSVMESHCGQIEWPPAGWSLIATAGEGTLTKTQCLRLDGKPIYAAQFHIEMSGTPESSRFIMANFLTEARHWREIHPR